MLKPGMLGKVKPGMVGKVSSAGGVRRRRERRWRYPPRGGRRGGVGDRRGGGRGGRLRGRVRGGGRRSGVRRLSGRLGGAGGAGRRRRPGRCRRRGRRAAGGAAVVAVASSGGGTRSAILMPGVVVTVVVRGTVFSVPCTWIWSLVVRVWEVSGVWLRARTDMNMPSRMRLTKEIERDDGGIAVPDVEPPPPPPPSRSGEKVRAPMVPAANAPLPLLGAAGPQCIGQVLVRTVLGRRGRRRTPAAEAGQDGDMRHGGVAAIVTAGLPLGVGRVRRLRSGRGLRRWRRRSAGRRGKDRAEFQVAEARDVDVTVRGRELPPVEGIGPFQGLVERSRRQLGVGEDVEVPPRRLFSGLRCCFVGHRPSFRRGSEHGNC